VSWCQKKKSSGLYGAREDNKGRHTDNPARRHSIQTNQRPTSIFPYFSCRNPPNLSWLGTGTKYAGLHNQWLDTGWGHKNGKQISWKKLESKRSLSKLI